MKHFSVAAAALAVGCALCSSCTNAKERAQDANAPAASEAQASPAKGRAEGKAPGADVVERGGVDFSGVKGLEGFAQEAAPEAKAKAKEAVAALLGDDQNLGLKAILRTPVEGVTLVVFDNNQPLWVAADGRHIITGEMIDVQNKRNLSAAIDSQLNKVDLSALDPKSAIKEVYGNGKRALHVFADPDCFYCRVLERDLLKNAQNVTVYTHLMGLEELHPDALRRATQIMCQKDPVKAWRKWMTSDGGDFSDSVPPVADCPNPVAANQRLSGELGVNGTPTLILADGRRIGGLLPWNELDAALDEAELAASKAAGKGR